MMPRMHLEGMTSGGITSTQPYRRRGVEQQCMWCQVIETEGGEWALLCIVETQRLFLRMRRPPLLVTARRVDIFPFPTEEVCV